MAKEKHAAGAAPPTTANKTADEAALRAEVAAFASQLGFASHSTNFEYDDFAPSKASRRVDGSIDAGSGGSGGSGSGPGGAAQRKSQKQQPMPRNDTTQQQKPGKLQQQQQNQEQPRSSKGATRHKQEAEQAPASDEQRKEDAIRTRTWVDSVGPRPGEARGRSLLGRDEPTVWHEAAAALPRINAAGAPPLDDEAADALRARAEALLERESALFEKDVTSRNAADARWLAQVRRSGTTADKVAAMSLLVSSSAVANVTSLDGLLAMMAKAGGGRTVVVAAMEALQEIFLTSLLPDRKLRVLEQQPLTALPPGRDGERMLLMWAVEDAVKRRYAQFVELLQQCSTSNLDFVKEKATRALSRLLAAKPEAEAALLAALVNKLGDPGRKLASDAAYMLSQLLGQHPAMKSVVVREVERFIFRPGLTERARYYAVTFLNQLPLSHRPQEGGAELAQRLVDVYFGLFRLLLEGRVGHAAERAAAAAAAGAAHSGRSTRGPSGPAARGRGGRGGRGGGHRRGATHSNADDGATTAAAQHEAIEAAGELDARMLSALITGVRRAFPYVAPEAVEELADTHSEALFKLVHTAPFTVALQALMLMHQLLSGRSAVSDRYYRALYAVLLSEGARGAAGVRAPQFLALLLKSMKGDVSAKRVAAFAKRLLQVACHAPASWAAGALLVLSEAMRQHPGLWTAVQEPEDAAGGGEVFQDVEPQETGEDEVEEGAVVVAAGSGGNDGSSSDSQDEGGAVALRSLKSAQQHQQQQKHQQQRQQPWPLPDAYDMRKREPMYALAEGSCFWELLLLSRHAHPSIAAFARQLLAGSHIVYTGDPLRDLGLPAFLDKFVNKKPKAAPRGTSLMQPTRALTAAVTTAATAAAAVAAAGHAEEGALGTSAPADVAELGSAAFAGLAEAEVAPDQLFFHTFYNLQSVKAKQKASTAARARRAAASAAAGLDGLPGLGAASDEEDGSDGSAAASDDSLDEAAVDAALTAAEGGAGAGDTYGDPDAGAHDYDSLMAAMAADDSDAGSSGQGDDDSDDAGGSSGQGDDDSDDAGGSSDGEGISEEQQGDDDGSADAADEDDELGSSEGLEPDERELSSSGGDDDDDNESSSSGSGDEGDWIMAPSAAAGTSSSGGDDGGSGSGKRKRQQQRHDAAAAGDVSDDAELEGLELLDLPSPSSSSSSGGDSEDEEGATPRLHSRPGQQQRSDEAESGSDIDLDLEQIIAGSDEDEEDDHGGFGEDDDDEDAAAVMVPGSTKRQGRSSGKGSGALFAAADDYEDFFKQFEADATAAEKAEQDVDEPRSAQAPASTVQRKRGGGRAHRAKRMRT